MKKILLVGLTDQEAAAIEIMIGMNWRDAQCTVLRRSLSLAMPEQTPEALACTHCVVDLFGLGMRKYSAENAERLMAFLGGRSAVALAWGADGGGWTGQKLPLAAGQVLELLVMPYSSHDMKTALGKVREGKAPAEMAAAPAGRTSAASSGGLGQILSQARTGSGPAPEPAPDKEVGLLKGAIPILLHAFPDLQGNPFFRLVQQIISHEGPQVLTFGDEMFFILAARGLDRIAPAAGQHGQDGRLFQPAGQRKGNAAAPASGGRRAAPALWRRLPAGAKAAGFSVLGAGRQHAPAEPAAAQGRSALSPAALSQFHAAAQHQQL